MAIHKEYANGPWAACESWLKTYQSQLCTTAAKAKANAEADWGANALTAAKAIKVEFDAPKKDDCPCEKKNKVQHSLKS